MVGTEERLHADLDVLVAEFREKYSDKIEITTASVEKINFLIDENGVIIGTEKWDLAQFDLVVFRLIKPYISKVVAMTRFLEFHKIKYIDSLIREAEMVDDLNKLAQMVELRLAKFNVPKTALGETIFLREKAKRFGFPIVLKAIDGSKGQNNFLAKDLAQFDEIVTKNPATQLILQDFIPNSGDYRILVLNYETALLSLRQRQNDKTHLNNASAGGTKTLITNYSETDKKIIEIGKKIAKLFKIEVCGVDIIADENTGDLYCIEANRAPTLRLPEEKAAYFEMICDLAK